MWQARLDGRSSGCVGGDWRRGHGHSRVRRYACGGWFALRRCSAGPCLLLHNGQQVAHVGPLIGRCDIPTGLLSASWSLSRGVHILA